MRRSLRAIVALTVLIAATHASPPRRTATGEGVLDATAVVINYQRPHNLLELVPALRRIPEVAEVVVLHCLPATYHEFPGVVNVRAFNDTYGATVRFLEVERYTHDAILFLDDDIVPAPALVAAMARRFRRDPFNLYGPMPRLCTRSGYGDGYDVRKKGYHNVVLTPILMASKRFVQEYVAAFDVYEPFLKRTHGNGEDLSLSHYLDVAYAKRPVVVTVADGYRFLDVMNGYSARPGHRTTRTEFCRQFYTHRDAEYKQAAQLEERVVAAKTRAPR